MVRPNISAFVRSFGGGGAGGSDIVVRRKRRRGRLRRSGRMVRVFLTTSPPSHSLSPETGRTHTLAEKSGVFSRRKKKVFLLLLLLRCFHLCYTLFLQTLKREGGGKPESLYFLMRRTSFPPSTFSRVRYLGNFFAANSLPHPHFPAADFLIKPGRGGGSNQAE